MCVKKLLFFVFVAAFTAVFCSCAAVPAPKSTARVRVRAVDGFTESPVAGACVTIPEAGFACFTGTKGETEPISVPVIPDAAYESLLRSDSGRITIIVTAPGYTPCLLLYARVVPGGERSIELLLFPNDGSLPVFTMVEAPDDEWCRRLTEKFAE